MLVTCTKCNEAKPREAFRARAAKANGLESWCRSCKDADRLRHKRSANYRKHNLEYYYRNKEKFAAAKARRRAAQLQRTPAWADSEWEQFATREAHDTARQRTEMTGVPHEVDHIVPLQGDSVSGLHCADNLRVITQFENRSKGAKHDTE